MNCSVTTVDEVSSSVSSIEFVRSVVSEEAGIPPYDVDEIFRFEGADVPTKEHDEARKLLLAPSIEVETPSGFVLWRVFLNCVDTFNSKHIARFLSTKVFGSLKVKEEEVVIDEELGMEEEEDLHKEKIEEPKLYYKIIGSLLSAKGKYENDVVSEIVDTSDRDSLLKTLKTCGFIVYDISRYPSQIDEARWVLHALEDELLEIRKATPKAFQELADVPTFVLISSFMTWANTKPADAENPGAPFHENNFKKRKCHPNYKEHAKLERELDVVGKKFPDKFKMIVLCSGMQYGYEEDSLNFLFRMAWENEAALPLYTNGRNFVPLVHIDDLAMMLFSIMEDFPQSRNLRYLLAVEQEMSNLKSITKCISKGLTTGDLIKVPKEQIKVSDQTLDCLTANVRMEPLYFIDSGMKWMTPASFTFNINNIIQEYRDSRKLNPIRILLTGPPGSGKTTLAKKIAEYYQLHYLNPQEVTNRIVQNIKNKIDKLNAKELAALEKELEEEEEEEEGEGEGEEEQEEEEEEVLETREELTELLEGLMMNIMENDGHLDQERLLGCLREILASPAIQNQGYILDDFPDTIPQLKKVFKGGVKRSAREDEMPEMGGEEVAEEELILPEEEEEESPPDAAPYPEFIIGLEATDRFILNRAMGLSAEEAKFLGHEEEELKKRLAAYRVENTEETGFLSFLDEREIHPILIQVEDDESEFFNDTLEKLKAIIGDPHNFGLTQDEADSKQRMSEEEKALEAAREEERKKQVEKQATEERTRKFALWAETKEVLEKAEEERYLVDRKAFRQYLKTYIYPTLKPGLKDVAKGRVADPVDFLAEYLLKENPEGKLFDPDKPRATRMAFEEMHKSRDTLFSVNALDRSMQNEFYSQPDDHWVKELLEMELRGEGRSDAA